VKNKDAIREIVRLADKLEVMESAYKEKVLGACSYKGYELANILCQNYNGRLSIINSLMYAKWLFWAKNLVEQLEVNNQKI